MTGVWLGLALPAMAVWLLVRAFHLRIAGDSLIVSAALAVGGGLGLSALTTFWFVAMGLFPGPGLVAVDASFYTALGLFGLWRMWRATGRSPVSPRDRSIRLTPADWAVRVVFGLIASLAIATVVREYAASPHGQWDAWAIWNQKARFLLRGHELWTEELKIDWSSPGHPLLVPSAVARLWAYAGMETTLVPATVALLFGASSVAMVMGTLDLGRRRAWVAGSVLLAPATFIQQIAAQQADIPVGFFFIATLGLLHKERVAAWLDGREARSALVLAGALSGLAAWTKNEGLLFLPVSLFLAAWLTWRHGRPRQVAWWAIGAAPAVLTVAWFKLVVAPVAPIYLSGGVLPTLFDIDRHGLVVGLIGERVFSWGGVGAPWVLPLGLAAAAAVSFTAGAQTARSVLVAALVLLTGYYVVWVITPIDVEFVVSTTFARVIAQMWPVIVLAAFSTGPATPRL